MPAQIGGASGEPPPASAAAAAWYLKPAGPLQPGNAAVALITDEHGRYLMQLRDDKPTIFYPGHWGCFGGALDQGESFEAALRRELIEELGLVIGPAAPALFTRLTFDFAFAGHASVGSVQRACDVRLAMPTRSPRRSPPRALQDRPPP